MPDLPAWSSVDNSLDQIVTDAFNSPPIAVNFSDRGSNDALWGWSTAGT